MIFHGDQNDKAKAVSWLRAMKKKHVNNRQIMTVQDGKAYHGYRSDIDATMKNAAIRREINRDQKFNQIQPIASHDKGAIRQYAAGIGISTADFYRDPQHMRNLIKDSDYSKFLLQDNAHKLID